MLEQGSHIHWPQQLEELAANQPNREVWVWVWKMGETRDKRCELKISLFEIQRLWKDSSN